MPKSADLPNAAVQHRLRTIDWLLHRYGSVTRRDLMDYFGLSAPQVSIDLRTYMEAAPGNAKYDARDRSYVSLPTYRRVFP